jgi:plasmid stability protein
MSNLTIAVDEEVIKRARIRAIEEGTSVSARLRDFLAAYAQGREPAVPAARSGLTQAGAEEGWLSQLRARVERYGGAEPDEWLAPRVADAGREPPEFPG